MADGSKAQKLKLANSRKRFKELQELKKKKNAVQKTENSDNICIEPTPVDSLTSSTHSSINNEQIQENIPEGCSHNQLPNYFNNIPDQDNHQQPAVFFDSFLQKDYNSKSNQNDFSDENISNNIYNFFSTSPTHTNWENMVSNIVDSPTSPRPNKNVTEKEYSNQENYSLFPQESQSHYASESQHVNHPHYEDAAKNDTEINHNEDFSLHESSENIFSAKDTKDLIDYLQVGGKEDISESENRAIREEIVDFSNQAKAEVQHSSVESLRQLSDQMAQLIEPEYCTSSSITDLEKRNLELAALLEHEEIKSMNQDSLINDLQMKVVQLEKEVKEKDEFSNFHAADQVRKLNEELKCHIQTVGMLVAEKAELSASLSQFEFCSKQKSKECEELQARLKASRSRVADLEREMNIMKSERNQTENTVKEHDEVASRLRQDYDAIKDQKEELVQDLLEIREKLKKSSEENMILQQQNQELSSKLSLANIKIQQITNWEQYQSEGQLEKLTQEKFVLEKQVSDLNQILKTVTKERDESSLQYQQYAQQQNTQLTNLSNKIEQLQIENENLSVQEQNRIKHISELERQLQNLQNEQVAFATNRNGGDSLKSDLETTRELCVQLQIEKTATEENYVKVVNEKEMLLKELEAKNDSVLQLEGLVEQLRGNQPDSVKLLATMESDKVAAARAVQQNKELKQQMESMQEVFMKLNNDKVDLTEQLNREVGSNKDLLEKLQRTELHLHTLTDAIEIKDRELSNLRENFTELNKQALQHEQLADRLRHYEAQDNVSHVVQNELQEAQQTIVKLTNEMKLLKHDANEKDDTSNTSLNPEDVRLLSQLVEELQVKNDELEAKLQNYADTDNDQNYVHKDNNSNETNNLDKEMAMKRLEDKFKQTMQDIADLTEEKQRLEHLVLQLQGETETIGEYVALYQHQRMVLKQKALEKDQQLKQLASDREQMKTKLEKLNELIRTLVVEKGKVPTELLEQHGELTSQSKNFCDEHYKIHEEINKISENAVQNEGENSETAEKIIALLSEIKSSNLMQPKENIHHCPWCSGQLLTV